MDDFKKKISFNRAQTAAELAIFGAVLIFVIGLIIRQGLNTSLQQNQNLKAMRMAMVTSYEFSQGQPPASRPSASRNFANVIVVEDRLSAASGKYAPIDRNPMILNGRAVFSKQLFMPLGAGEYYNLPALDIFINGQRFVFTIAGFKTLDVWNSEFENLPPPPPGTPDHGQPGPDTPINSVTGLPEWDPNCVTIHPNDGVSCTPSGSGSNSSSGQCTLACQTATCSSTCDPINGGVPGCQPIPPSPDYHMGCTKFFSIIINNPGTKGWCNGFLSGVGAKPCPPYNLPADERFNLDHAGLTDVPAAPQDLRTNFAWQWFLVKAYNLAFKLGSKAGSNGLPMIKIDFNPPGEGINFKKNKNIDLDVDGDTREEHIVKILSVTAVGIIEKIDVLDSQVGDMDLSYDSSSSGPQAGLMKDLQMYSFTNTGTYLELSEGKLFTTDPNKQFVRSVQKNDHIDIIERAIQLSNDTHRFCDSTGVPTNSGSPNPEWAKGNWNPNGGLPNPVEACNNCFSPANRSLTCMDQGSKIIFVRSRVENLHGRKWVTDTSGDSYIDVNSN